jgi:hypothetical protein
MLFALKSPSLDLIAGAITSGTLTRIETKLDQIIATQAVYKQELETLMSQITDWAAKEQADLSAIRGSLGGIVTGIQALNDKITALQNSPGTLSPSDQAALDSIQADSDSLVTLAGSVIAVPPPTPPPGA